MSEQEAKKQMNVCWMTGNYRQRITVLNKVRDMLASKGEYEYSPYGKDVTIEYVYSQIVQRSCFETQKLIVIHDWPTFETTKPTMLNHFVKMCQKADDGVIVVCNDLKTDSDKFLKEMSKIARMYDFENECKKWEAPRWVVKEMGSREKNMSEADAEILVQAVGTKGNEYSVELDKLYLTCDKLCDFVGKRANITTEDVVSACTDSSEFITWSLLTLLDQKNFCEAMKLANKGLSSAKTAQDFVEGIMYSMLRKYKLLIFAKEGSSQGWDASEISSQVSNLHKLKRSGNTFKMSYSMEQTDKNDGPKSIYTPKNVEKIFESFRGSKPQIFCYTRPELFWIIEAIEQTMQKLRFGVCESEAIALLDAVFMTACQIGDTDMLREIRRENDGRYC